MDNNTNTGTVGQSIATSAGVVPQPTPNEQGNPTDVEQEKMFDFPQAKIHLKRLVDDWHTEVEDTEVRRKTRDVEIDVEGLRQKGDLDEDETIVPDRVIDTNITREQPPYINYLKNSRRLCIFDCLSNPEVTSTKIELEYTKGMTYTNWETPYFKTLDGAQTHGWAAVEVVFDQTKPLNVGIEYIEHDCLFFPRTIKDLQDSSRVIRCYDVTISRLKEWVREFGFNLTQVNKIIASRRDTQKEAETIRIYKLFFKKDKVIHVAWFNLTDGVDDWLKAPVKHFVGIKNKDIRQVISQMGGMPQEVETWNDADLDMYPIFLLPYRESEKPKVVDKKGRVFLDEPKQEAQTAILSGFINGLTRASNVYASPSTEDGSGSSLKELNDVKLVGGRILNKPMTFWGPHYPDPMVLKAMQWMDTANAEETNQVSFATMNREDSRKTAKEIGAAQQKENLLNSVQLTLFSTFIRQIHSFAWLIVQSQALQNKIRFCLIKQQKPQINPVTKQPMMDADGQPVTTDIWINDVKTIAEVWDIRAAGDVDVIQKEETINKMKQDWPVVSGTALRDTFLADLIRLEYPDTGERYAQVLQQNGMMQQMQSLIARLGTVMNGMMEQHPDMMGTLSAQDKSDLSQLMTEAKQFTGQQQQ